jgi:RNA polymerase sigma-70 factor, ECF subfamily
LKPETPDEQLMLAFRSGDARAFEALVRRHRGPVYNFILRFTGQRARAEDVLQETWLKVVRGAENYEAKAKFTTWLYTVARNLCVDSARKESYRSTDSLDAPAGRAGSDGPLLGETLSSEQRSPEREAHNLGLRPLLERALLALPDEQREVFLLREYSGISFKEIGEVTGVSENTVKSRMRYALEGLRKKLGELGVEGGVVGDGRTVAV